MKISNLFSSVLALSFLFAPAARADIAFTEQGRPTGYLVKLVHENDSVGFQLYVGDTYLRNLGHRTRYSVQEIRNYNASLPQKIKYDHGRRIAFRTGGTIVGVAAGLVVTSIIANANSRPGGGYLSNLGGALAGMIAIGPSTILGGIGGWFAGGALDNYFFISTDRHELRATLTSDLMLKNDRVVLDVESAEEAAAELDAALNEI
jgi:hypothetical protein